MADAPAIAAVLTVHDRVELTLRCLDALDRERRGSGADVTAYVMDDGSRDGTADRVRAAHPEAVVLLGDGSFFWNGGMRVAMARAMRDDPDYYLWLNDDTVLRDGALAALLDTAGSLGGPAAPAVVCGAVVDPADGSLPYSGVRQRRLQPMWFDQVGPVDRPTRVDTMNGNCVLVSREVVRRIGNLSPAYRHGMGDYDYGLRLGRAGGAVWLAPGVVGECRANPGFVEGSGGVVAEFARFRSVKHLPPGEWAHFARRWAGPAWPVFWASPYLRRLLRSAAAGIRRRRRA